MTDPYVSREVRFIEDEANALVNTRVVAKRAYSLIPVGASGRIVGIEDMTKTGQYDVIVEWDLGVKDWFTKGEYEEGLQAVEKPSPAGEDSGNTRAS